MYKNIEYEAWLDIMEQNMYGALCKPEDATQVEEVLSEQVL